KADGDREEAERPAHLPGEGGHDRRLVGSVGMRDEGYGQVRRGIREGGFLCGGPGDLREPCRRLREHRRERHDRHVAEPMRSVEAEGGGQAREGRARLLLEGGGKGNPGRHRDVHPEGASEVLSCADEGWSVSRRWVTPEPR